MKYSTFSSMILSFVLGGACLGETTPSTPPRDSAAKSEVPVPETPEALWSQIDAQRKAFGEAVAGNNKADVSRIGDLLKELTKMLPSKYPDTVAAKKKSIHHEAKMIGRLCDDVNDLVQQGKAEDAKPILVRIDELIKFVRESAAKK